MNKFYINEHALVIKQVLGYKEAAIYLKRHGYTFDMTHHLLFGRGPRFRIP